MKDFFPNPLKKAVSNIPEQGILSKEFVDLIYPTSVPPKNGAKLQWLNIYYFRIMSAIPTKKKHHDMVVPGPSGIFGISWDNLII